VAHTVHPDPRASERLRGLLPRFRELSDLLFGEGAAP
jgi:hypothetical protein